MVILLNDGVATSKTVVWQENKGSFLKIFTHPRLCCKAAGPEINTQLCGVTASENISTSTIVFTVQWWNQRVVQYPLSRIGLPSRVVGRMWAQWKVYLEVALLQGLFPTTSRSSYYKDLWLTVSPFLGGQKSYARSCITVFFVFLNRYYCRGVKWIFLGDYQQHHNQVAVNTVPFLWTEVSLHLRDFFCTANIVGIELNIIIGFFQQHHVTVTIGTCVSLSCLNKALQVTLCS